MLPMVFAAAQAAPVPLTNRKSGISVSLSGRNGADWAVEETYHDGAIADQIIYLESSVRVSLAHNENNSIMMTIRGVDRQIGVDGPDRKPGTGDEGVIHYKIDRDLQAHQYAGDVPAWAPVFREPFSVDTLTYDGSRKVLGSVGGNGGKWGSEPSRTTERHAFGMHDAFENEWHVLTYWDDDLPVYKSLGKSPHRQGASDGHLLNVCVNPKTPVLQFLAERDGQFYTTPIKTYHVPRVWTQKTYLTADVAIQFVNLTNDASVLYRVGDQQWRAFGGKPIRAADLFTEADREYALEAKCGADGVVLRRSIRFEPDYPAPAERHGFLLWPDDAGYRATVKKLHEVEPFRESYGLFCGGYYQGTKAQFTDVRGGWRATAAMAATALNNAFAAAIDGPAKRHAFAKLAKARLLRIARLEPVGNEIDVNRHTPSKDFLNELGQTLQQFADAGVAYDLLAAHSRRSAHPDGLSPIEEIYIRDRLAKIAKSILQFRSNYSAISGGGDAHWPHGYELAFGIIASAMPTYKTPYYGVSGADGETKNDLSNSEGKYWNPFPDQGVTWYQCATDPRIDTPGHPNVRYPFRAEFIYSDDGYWTGPNDLQGDGNRYVSGPMGRRLADVKYGCLANCECRVEQVEMAGYEAPFVMRTYVFDSIRRIRGDTSRPHCVTNYLTRRLVSGWTPLKWDNQKKVYSARPPRAATAVFGHNSRYPSAANAKLVRQYLDDLKAYYGLGGSIDAETRKWLNQARKVLYGAYALALCDGSKQLPTSVGVVGGAPLLKTLFKHVVKPGEPITKDIIATDLAGSDIETGVTDLPAGATFDLTRKRITWTPTTGDEGVYLTQVTAQNRWGQIARPFPIIVKANAGRGPVPSPPASLAVEMVEGQQAVKLTWRLPAKGAAPRAYLIYRDGILRYATDGDVTTWTDRERIYSGSNTRYWVSLLAADGSESPAVGATPQILGIP